MSDILAWQCLIAAIFWSSFQCNYKLGLFVLQESCNDLKKGPFTLAFPKVKPHTHVAHNLVAIDLRLDV